MQQCHCHIVHVGAGRSGQPADHPLLSVHGRHRFPAASRQHPALCRQGYGGLSVHIAAGASVGPSVPSLPTENTAASSPAMPGAAAKRQLLIPSAQTLAGQVDHRFTACKKGKFSPCPAWLFRMLARKLPASRASQQSWVREHDRLIAQSAALLCGGSAQLPDAAGNAGGDVVQRLGGLLLQRACASGESFS